MRDAVAANKDQQSNADNTKHIHQRRTDRGGCHRAKIGAEKPTSRVAEPGNFPIFSVKGLHDTIAGDGLVQNVLNFR